MARTSHRADAENESRQSAQQQNRSGRETGGSAQRTGEGGQPMTESRGGSLAHQRSQQMPARGAYPINRLRSEFDRLFENFFPGWPMAWGRGEESEQHWGMQVDERDDQLIVQAEAPGFEKEDFDLQVRDNQLIMSAKHNTESQEDGGRAWRREEFYRSMSLPTGIDADHVQAQYRNGILTITIPKTEQAKGKRIEIKE